MNNTKKTGSIFSFIWPFKKKHKSFFFFQLKFKICLKYEKFRKISKSILQALVEPQDSIKERRDKYFFNKTVKIIRLIRIEKEKNIRWLMRSLKKGTFNQEFQIQADDMLFVGEDFVSILQKIFSQSVKNWLRYYNILNLKIPLLRK